MNLNQAVQQHLDLTARIKSLNEQRSALGNAILTGMDEQETSFVVGTEDDHGLKKVETVRWTLNQKAVKEEMGDEWVTAHSTQGLVTSLRLSRDK